MFYMSKRIIMIKLLDHDQGNVANLILGGIVLAFLV